MTCANCCLAANRFGKDRKGFQRCYRCPGSAEKTFTQPHNGSVQGTYATIQRAENVIRLLVEGNSISQRRTNHWNASGQYHPFCWFLTGERDASDCFQIKFEPFPCET